MPGGHAQFRMRKAVAAIVMASTLFPIVPAIAQAPRPAGVPAAAAPKRDTHATHGIVKSIDRTLLVVSRSRHRGDITFTLSEATRTEGTIAVGATVSVRYREDGKRHLALAVTVH